MYILECSDGSYYTGSTWDLERRLWEHQNGLGARHTAKRLPVRLIYFEECDRIDDAYYREKQVQGWSHKKKEALIAGDKNMMHNLAECQNESHYRRFSSLSGVEGNGNRGGGFDFAQPTGDSAQRAVTSNSSLTLPNCSLSEVEGSDTKLRGIIG